MLIFGLNIIFIALVSLYVRCRVQLSPFHDEILNTIEDIRGTIELQSQHIVELNNQIVIHETNMSILLGIVGDFDTSGLEDNDEMTFNLIKQHYGQKVFH